MRMTKKVLSIVLAVMMVVSMMSVMAVSANAATGVAEINGTNYETLEAAFAAAHDGDTITVLANCAGNGIKVTPAGKFANGLTVDFNGHTYTVDGETVGSTGTETNGFQLLKNNKVTFENGTITSTKAKILVQNYSDLTLDKMTLTLNNPNYTSAYTLSDNNGEVVINDTTINANPAGGFAFDVCRFSSYPSVNVKVTGNSVINGDVEISADKSDAKDGFSLKLESGEMYGEVITTSSAAAAMDAAPEKAAITIKDDFKFYVAKNGSTKYETLEAAFAAAQDGDTITVLADCAGNGIKAPQGKFANGLTVDFAGHTYTIDGTTVGSTGTETNGFQLLKDNKITFENGTITSTKAKILVQNYSDLTLNKMTLTLNNPNYAYAYTLSDNNGEVVINDTTINANPAGGYAFDVCRFSSYPSVKVTVTGNSLIKGNVEVYASGSDAKDGFSLTLESGTLNGNIVLDDSAKTALANTPEKASVNKAAGFSQAAPEGYMWVDTATEGVQTIAKAVAQIGTTKYATLEAAFAAAQGGDKITVLADCAGNGIKAPQGKFANGLTVDFAGHTYTVNANTVGSTGTETQAFQLLKDNKITFQNGTITSSVAKMLVQNYSNLTLDNMVLDGRNLDGSGRYTLSNNNGNVVINDTTIYAKGGKGSGNYAFDVCRFSSYPSVKVTVTGNSTINGDVEVSASKNDPKNGFSLTLESGTMDGNIVLDDSAKTALANAPERVSVNKAADFAQAAPEGYMWKNAVQGVQELTVIPEDDVLTPVMTKEADGNQFGLGNLEYHFGTLLGVQKKDALDGAARTSENGAQEDGNDLRFVAVLKTDILRNAQDYGFVLAKVNSSKTTESVAPNINALSADGAGKGEKVISAKGSSNTICGDYGELGTYTSYKYITCAVNGIEDGTKVVARFYVKIGGKTYYAQYPKGGNYDGNFTAAVAGMSDLG